MRAFRGRTRWLGAAGRLLVIVSAVLVAASLFTAAGPARAGVAAPSAQTAASTLSSLHIGTTGLPKDTLNSPAVTPPAGNVTVDIDLGTAYSQTWMKSWINQVQNENAHISDTIERFLQDRPANYPGGVTVPAVPQFDGTLSLDSDGTGLSLTIPAAEADVQTSATWWQNLLIGVAGFLVASLVIGGCLVAFPEAAAVCGGVGWAAAGFVGAVISGAIAGTLGTANAWGTALAAAAVGFVAGSGAANPVGTWLVTKLPGYIAAFATYIVNKLASAWSWLISLTIWQTAATFLTNVANGLGALIRSALESAAASSLPCDTYDAGSTPCAAAYSTARALYSFYDGPLYQVRRASDSTTADIGLLATGGYVNAAEQDSFCAGTTCTISKIYDQSPAWNDLTVEGAGGAAGADGPASATALPITVNGHKAYGVDFTGGIGYRDNTTQGIAVNGQPEGMYMVASGTNVNSGCCFDFGNAETSTHDTGASDMDAVNLTTYCEFSPCSGSGPWVEADMENGQYMGGNGSNPNDTTSNSDFVTAVLKNDGQTTFELEGGNGQSGGLTKYWDGNLPSGYSPMHQQGAIVLGTGGDNSNSDVGSFFEGVMTQGFPSDAADATVQANIVSAGYAGNSGTAPGGGGGGSGGSGSSSGALPSAAGPAVVHAAGATGQGASGFSSVYTVDSSTGDLQETYLPYIGAPWTTQNLSANYGTPPVMSGTLPVSVVHCGYTSVFTVDRNGDLQETYLSNIGNSWATHDLTTLYGTPVTDETPTAVVHDAGATGLAAACGFTSVYTIDSSNNDLQETYLPYINDAWTTQNLSANYGTPPVRTGTAPVSLMHCGYTSVWTIDANGHLQETYLSNIGNTWATHDLSALYGTPATTNATPTVVVHTAGATGLAAACGFTSVYTVDAGSGDLQETYLPYINDAWTTQNLSANYGTPPVAAGTAPVALYHTGYTSVFTVDTNYHLQETYLSNIGNTWATHDLNALDGTPPTDSTPVVLLHPASGGALTWTSVYTVNTAADDLQESYLPAIGDAWTTQNLSTKYGTPPASAP